MNPIPLDDFGEIPLVEGCQRIRVEPVIKSLRAQIEQMIFSSEMTILDQKVALMTSNTFRGGVRHWFACPRCGQRVGSLYVTEHQEIGCRNCLNLRYAKSRYKGMIEEEVFGIDNE